jgi:voltage-gated potassium channel
MPPVDKPGDAPAEGGRSMRRIVYELMNTERRDAKARTFRFVHHLVVVAGIAAVALDTSPAVHEEHGRALELVFHVAVAFFVVEYALRLYAAPEWPLVQGLSPSGGRLQWALSLNGVVELILVVPILIAMLVGEGFETVRLLCVLWLIRLAPYSEGIVLLGRVMRHARSQLLSVLLAFAIVFVGAATLQYLFERDAHPEAFGSIPSALWWAIVTLTTTGYGDTVPITVAGRILAGLVMICGIAVFALWAGILASGFYDELRRRNFVKTWDLVAKVPLFRDVGAGTIADMARLLRPREVSPGTAVVRRGEAGDAMYFIVDGEVEVLVDPRPVRLGPGDFFGEIALVTSRPRTSTVIARQMTMLLALDLADFLELAARRPELRDIIDREAQRRLKEVSAC